MTATATKNGTSKRTKRITTDATSAAQKTVTIAPPNFQIGEFTIKGITPYVQEKFSEKAREQMRAKQEAGSTAKKGGKRDAKDFQQCFQDAQYRDADNKNGIPAGAIRSAMISSCRLCGFQMTRAKIALFVEADSFDRTDGIPLVFITGEPQYFEQPVRNDSGVADLRARPMWEPGWTAAVRIRFDADIFTLDDVANLLLRAGMQVGIGAGRPDSRKSTGVGWGLFEIDGGS